MSCIVVANDSNEKLREQGTQNTKAEIEVVVCPWKNNAVIIVQMRRQIAKT